MDGQSNVDFALQLILNTLDEGVHLVRPFEVNRSRKGKHGEPSKCDENRRVNWRLQEAEIV
jgi:hypothetical protein